MCCRYFSPLSFSSSIQIRWLWWSMVWKTSTFLLLKKHNVAIRYSLVAHVVHDSRFFVLFFFSLNACQQFIDGIQPYKTFDNTFHTYIHNSVSSCIYTIIDMKVFGFLCWFFLRHSHSTLPIVMLMIRLTMPWSGNVTGGSVSFFSRCSVSIRNYDSIFAMFWIGNNNINTE